MGTLKHAKLSASGSAMWLSCPAAPALNEAFCEDKGSSHASLGTAAHELAEKCLKEDLEPLSFEGSTIEADGAQFTVDKNMIDAVTVYTNLCRSIAGDKGIMFVEHRVDFSAFVPEGFGTSDCAIEVQEPVGAHEADRFEGKELKNVLYAVDYKHGEGVPVHAYENSQGMLYTLGALETFEYSFLDDIDEVVVVICQPRKDSVTEYRMYTDEILEWGREYVTPRAQLAWKLLQKSEGANIDAENEELRHIKPEHFGPSDKACQWCGMKKKCKEKYRRGAAAILDGFGDMTLEEQSDVEGTSSMKGKNFHEISDDELAELWANKKHLEKIMKGLDEYILDRMEAGDEIPGLEARKELGNLKWKLEDDEVVKKLKTAGFKKVDYDLGMKIPTPAKARDMLPKLKPDDHEKRFNKLKEAAIEQPFKAPKIVKAGAPGEHCFNTKAQQEDEEIDPLG